MHRDFFLNDYFYGFKHLARAWDDGKSIVSYGIKQVAQPVKYATSREPAYVESFHQSHHHQRDHGILSEQRRQQI